MVRSGGAMRSALFALYVWLSAGLVGALHHHECDEDCDQRGVCSICVTLSAPIIGAPPPTVAQILCTPVHVPEAPGPSIVPSIVCQAPLARGPPGTNLIQL